jgi:hypothetical protein
MSYDAVFKTFYEPLVYMQMCPVPRVVQIVLLLLRVKVWTLDSIAQANRPEKNPKLSVTGSVCYLADGSWKGEHDREGV